MFIDGRSLDGQVLHADLCIIGAGPAGISIAQQFLDANFSVILVESGNFEADDTIQSLNRGEISGIKTSLDYSRLRQFGGATNHWEGMCAPLQPLDFQKRDWVKFSGWPFGIQEMLPYYKQASAFLNTSGNASHDFNAPQDSIRNDGTLSFHFWRFPENLLVGEKYKASFKNSSAIKVILNSTITRIKADKQVKTISGLVSQTLEGQKFTIDAKRYVLAVGGIENARMLLLSRDVAPAGLGNQNDLVGRFFMQHPHVDVGHFYAFGDTTPLQKFRQQTGSLGHPFKHKPDQMHIISLSAEELQKRRILNGALTVYSMSTATKKLPDTLQVMRNSMDRAHDPVSDVVLRIRSEQAPNPDSRITLSKKMKDPFGLPSPHAHWDLTEFDWLSIKELSIAASCAVSANQLGVMKLHNWLNKYTAWPKGMHGGSHHMGTTRMHDDPKLGVVDSNCKVHGISNLYVAGSSVFPSVGWANPTYTIVALALRLANHLKSGI